MLLRCFPGYNKALWSYCNASKVKMKPMRLLWSILWWGTSHATSQKVWCAKPPANFPQSSAKLNFPPVVHLQASWGMCKDTMTTARLPFPCAFSIQSMSLHGICVCFNLNGSNSLCHQLVVLSPHTNEIMPSIHLNLKPQCLCSCIFMHIHIQCTLVSLSAYVFLKDSIFRLHLAKLTIIVLLYVLMSSLIPKPIQCFLIFPMLPQQPSYDLPKNNIYLSSILWITRTYRYLLELLHGPFLFTEKDMKHNVWNFICGFGYSGFLSMHPKVTLTSFFFFGGDRGRSMMAVSSSLFLLLGHHVFPSMD